jgi:hypothetical protein
MKKNFVLGMVICISLLAVTASAVEYDRDARMILPRDYRQWVFLTSSIGMSYLPAVEPTTNPRFENIFVNPVAYQSFLKTGTWPDKTVLILEARGSDTNVSINKSGRVQTDVLAVEAHVKDASKGGWAFYNFGNGLRREGTLFPKSANCYSCHEQNAAVDTTFVQFYSTFAEIAKAKGTFAEKSTVTRSGQAAPKQ